MTYVTCRLTAKNRDQLRNPTLGNRIWATFMRTGKRTCHVISTAILTLEDLFLKVTLAYAVKVLVSRKRCEYIIHCS